MRQVQRWFVLLFAFIVTLGGVLAAPAGAVDAPVGRLGDTLRVENNGLIADVTVVSIELSEVPPGFGYPPRPPRHEVYRGNVIVRPVKVPNPFLMAVTFQFRGVTPTGDAYEPRNSDAPDALLNALRNAPAGSTVGGGVWWDCYRDLVSNVVLLDKKSGVHLAQWNVY
jgi:hypothetical protein